MKKSILLLSIVALIGSLGLAQNAPIADYSSQDTANYPYWIEMMQNPEVNVFETVKAFEKYWEYRPDRKGNGYKPFKRWEWLMKHKTNPDGSWLAADYDLKAYKNYQQGHRGLAEFSGDWENLGPIELPDSPDLFWGNGRINAIAFHPTDADIIYIGAPAGGIWKTADGGQNWIPLSDEQPTLGVSSIIVDYVDPDIIYAGSGDRDAGDAAGLGVFKSIDGGAVWIQMNNGMGNVDVGRMIQHPFSNNTIFAATSGGIFKTTDGGQNWVQKNAGNTKDVLFKPNNPSIIYAVRGANFFRSNDDGENWQLITSGLPSDAYRAVIGVSPDQPEYVYFFATDQNAFYGLYRSVDGGDSFELRSDSPNIMGWECEGGEGGQAWYDLDMIADPLNAEIIYGGGVNCWKSMDGGQNWVMNSNQTGDCDAYPVHADLHVFEYNPVDGKLYVGNDGGIWWTEDGGAMWNRIVDGLVIGQQYKLGQSNLTANHVTTGYQDNGISTYHTDTWIQSDMYADGMECSMDIVDTTLGYGCAQFGWLVRRENDKYTTTIGGEDIGGIDELGDWVTPFCQHETNPNVMFLGYQNLWRTTNLLDSLPSWTKISGGTNVLTVVEHSPVDVNTFYFSSWDTFYRSENIMNEIPGIENLTQHLPDIGTIMDIEAHPRNRDVVYIVQNRKVFKSGDKGISWEDISGSLPDVSLNDIAFYDRNGTEGLYVASNIGVFFKDENMEDWVEFSNGLPAAIWATEVEIYHHPNDPIQDRIRISTFGRGLWSSPPYHYQPMANFESEETQIPIGCALDFYDRSAGYPQSWSWTFEGGTPSTSDEANPTGIVYTEEGEFEVSLTVTNSEGTDTKTITSYITVDNTLLPVVNFEAIDTVQCFNEGTIQFYDLSEACPNSWEWSFSPNTVNYLEGSSPNSENPLVEFAENGSYSVNLKVTNGIGESELTKENYISIGGNFIPFYEDFQGESFYQMGWEFANPDGSKTWELISLGSQMAWMNFFNYTGIGERDYLTSSPMNFQGFDEVFMTFSYAYAQRFNQKDSLIVNISNDCGETWTRVYANGPNGEGIFATAETTDEFFVPTTTEDWCGAGFGADCPLIDLSDWAGQSNIKIQFETVAAFGNNLYLRNVNIGNTVGMGEGTSVQQEPFLFFPNPTNGQLTIVNLVEEKGSVQILDIQGKIVSTNVLAGKQLVLDVNHLERGIYFIRYDNENVSRTKKLIIQ